MNVYLIAFMVGLFGSVHCVGMCGPLAFAVPVNRGGRWLFLWDKLVYQLGRTVSYMLIGLLAGLIGRQIWLLGLQRGLSIFSGALILVAAIGRLFKVALLSPAAANRPGAVNRLLMHALNRRWGHVVVGMLNGFLPCGFVYLALAGALNTTSALTAAQYMFWFGIGTLPLMFAAAVSSGLVTIPVRRKLNAVIPYFMLFLGTWFILRGMALDIPYLSPLILPGVSTCQ